jgi:hypothetical protein
MVTPRTCQATNAQGQRCGTPPLKDGVFCFVHDPAHAEAAAEARRLGGMRRKREHTVAGIYEVGLLTSVAEIRRLVQIVTVDTLGLENGVARNRTLLAAAVAALKLLEVGELEERLRALEAAVKGPRGNEPSVFDQTFEGTFVLVEAES